VAKEKKKKKKDKKVSGASSRLSKSKPRKASKSFKSLSQNPLVADIVASALVATAAALKDSNKARQLAAQAGDELTKLSKEGAKQGGAMWQLALDIGRRSLEALGGEDDLEKAKPSNRTRRKPK
jgi:hypothetical protein